MGRLNEQENVHPEDYPAANIQFNSKRNKRIWIWLTKSLLEYYLRRQRVNCDWDTTSRDSKSPGHLRWTFAAYHRRRAVGTGPNAWDGRRSDGGDGGGPALTVTGARVSIIDLESVLRKRLLLLRPPRLIDDPGRCCAVDWTDSGCWCCCYLSHCPKKIPLACHGDPGS